MAKSEIIYRVTKYIFFEKKPKSFGSSEIVTTFALRKQTGCSSARLEYTSGGRVVAGSNPVTPTEQK